MNILIFSSSLFSAYYGKHDVLQGIIKKWTLKKVKMMLIEIWSILRIY